jgi:hypothetical protein
VTRPAQPMTAVIADNYRQFADWCQDQQLNPRDPALCLVVHVEHARGRRFDRVVTLSSRSPDLLAAVLARQRPPVETET